VRCRRLVVAAALLAVASCGTQDDRPNDTAWEPVWERWRDSFPAAEAFVDQGQVLCDELVGQLRSGRQELLPTPSEGLDAAVHAWIAHAQSLAFDCPTDASNMLRDRLHDLNVLAAEIDAGLIADEETP
jgi:hypothetical protein